MTWPLLPLPNKQVPSMVTSSMKKQQKKAEQGRRQFWWQGIYYENMWFRKGLPDRGDNSQGPEGGNGMSSVSNTQKYLSSADYLLILLQPSQPSL